MLSSIAAAALVMGTLAPAAFAQTASTYSDVSSGSYAATQINELTAEGFIHGFSDGTFRPNDPVTRGQFLAYFMKAVESTTGVKPQANAQYYADIPPKNWDFNFVGAAQEAGWINQYWIGVRPGYNFNENYHASWGDAASFFVAAMEKAGLITTTNGMAPLAYAKSIGLFAGIPSTENQIYLDRASAAIVLENIIAYTKGQLLPTGATVSVSGGASMAPGSSEQLTVSVKNASGTTITLPSTANVQWSVDNSNGFFNPNTPGQLVVTSAGTYNVTATVDGVASQSFAVSVYGAAAGVKLSAASPTIVANGQSTDAITATVVDANGNPVTGFNGTLNVADTAGWLAGASGSVSGLTAVTVTNGVATFNVNAPISPGLSDSVTVSGVTPTGGAALSNVSASTSLTSVAQVATGVTVTPSAAVVQDNVATQDNVGVQVVDQAGKPMLFGSFPVTVTVTGNALINGGKSYSTAYIGNGSITSPTSISVPVTSIQGQGGSITINAASGTLTQGNATISSVTVGAPTAVSVKLSGASSSFVAGSTGTTFNVTTVDSNGNPVGTPIGSSYTTSITNTSTGLAATGVSASVVNGVMTVTGTAAGTYNVTVSSGTLTSATVQVTITAAGASQVAITSPANTVSVSQASPSVAITAQVEDANGNPVAVAGVPVTFTAQQNMGVPGAVYVSGAAYSFNGVSSAPYTVLSNASGQATVTFASPSIPNLSWNVEVSQVNNVAVTGTPPTVRVNTVGLPASSLTVSTTVNGAQTSYATSGNTVTYNVYEKDAYGNSSPNGDIVDVTIPAGMTVPTNSGLLGSSTTGYYVQMSQAQANLGSATFNLQAGLAGAQTVSFKDITNASSSLTASQTVSVTAAGQSTAMFFDSSGLINSNNLLAVTAGVPTAITLEPTDAAGNLALSSNTLYYNLTDTNGGQYRLTPNGQTVTGVSLAPGQTSITLYYVNPIGGSYSGMGVVPATPPAAASTGSISVTNNVYTLNFSQPINIGTLSMTGISVASNTGAAETFGTGATLSAVNPSNGYASSFNLTAGTGANVASGSTITVAQSSVVNQAGQSAANAVTFTTP